MTTAIDLEHLRTWIGRSEEAEELLTPNLVARFAATLDITAARDEGAAAPLLIHWCLAQPAAPTSMLGPDGHPARGGFLPPVPLPRRMRAGGSLAFHRHIKIGDRVRRVSRIADVSLKEGRSGVLCFVTVENEIRAGEHLAFEEREDIVYREPASGPEAAAPGPAEIGEEQREVPISTVLLFRYSALTFNGHRFHYDHRYATQVEGYPGLVVHGPLQATLLLHFATTLGGRPPGRFDFRSVSTVYETDRLFLHATHTNGSLRLWTARDDGTVAMRSQAHWRIGETAFGTGEAGRPGPKAMRNRPRRRA